MISRCLRNFPLVGFPLVALGLTLATGVAWAQATAQLAGRVTDESGAVLPGVTVTATQTDTAASRTSVTDGAGAWILIEPSDRPVSSRGFTPGLSDVCPDRHCVAGRGIADHQYVTGGRQLGGNGVGGSGGTDRGRAKRRNQRCGRTGADCRVAAAGPRGHRSHPPGGFRHPDWQAQQQRFSGGREHFGRGRHARGCRVHPRRRHAQRRAE